MQAVLDYLRRVWQIIKEFWQGRERKDRMRFLLISSVALIGMIFAIIMLSRTSYGELYTGIDAAEVGEIRDILRANNVRNIVEGNTIKIPQEQVSEWRVTLAMEGYPKSGLDYSHIEGAAGFGMSDFDKQWRSVTQRQEDIRRSIMANSNVRDARVMITQPNNSGWIFASDVIPVTASVSLSLINPLSPAAVSGIISMTASAYPGLAEENVTVVDQNGFQLNPLPPGELDILASQAERVAQIERELESNLMRILTPIVGIDKSQVSVNATVNFDDVSSESVTYSPVVGNDEGIVVSLQESMEKAEGARMAGQVGEDENGGDVPFYDETGDAREKYESSMRTINYEVNQLVERITQAKGQITDLTVTIAIDSNDLLSEHQDTRLFQDIAAGVLGLDRTAYNSINVRITPFEGLAQQRAAQAIYADQLATQELINLILRIALWVFICVCIVVVIWRIFRLISPPPTEEELLALQQISEMDELDEYADLVRLASDADVVLEETKTPERMKLEDFIERSPEMVANLLRNWLEDESQRQFR